MSARLLPASFAIVGATALTLRPLALAGAGRRLIDESSLGIVERANIVVREGRIEALGREAPVPSGLPVVEAGGRVVMPGLVDAHTHALFAGNRIADFEAVSEGRKPELGIRHTVEQTRACGPDELAAIGAQRLGLMAAHGTTTAEVKTGYALTAAGEVAMLRAMRDLDGRDGLPHVIPTFCGAHALPPEFADYDAFVDALIADILPPVAAAKLARFADAFCETGYFTVPQSERFLKACATSGMRLRLHADELAHSGGAQLAAALGCASADHLNFADDDDIRALARAGCTAVLCPATTEYLGLERFAPARKLIEAGVPVALATDFNPGTSPSPSLQIVAHLARRRLHMTAPETIAAVTVQAARSLDAPSGALATSATADLIVLETSDYREFGYYFGANVVREVSIGAKNR